MIFLSIKHSLSTERKDDLQLFLTEIELSGPLCLNNDYLPKMHHGLNPFAMEEKEIHKEKNISRVIIGTAK